MYKVLLLKGYFTLFITLTSAMLNGEDSKYSNKWVANIEGGVEVAKRVARDLGYTYKDHFGEFKDYYELVREDHPTVSERDSHYLTKSLLGIDEVKWAKQLMFVKILPTGFWPFYSEEDLEYKLFSFLSEEAKNPQRVELQCDTVFSCLNVPFNLRRYLASLNQKDINQLGSISTDPTPASQLSTYEGPTKNIGLQSKKVSAYLFTYNDPEWKYQWYLQDYRTTDVPVMDLNVVPVHRMGYTGKGVIVAVVDQGIEPEHPDLKPNLIERLSYDYCDNIPGSTPQEFGYLLQTHGTKTAGVIAMVANNKECGVGIAYDAKIVGIRAVCPNAAEDTIPKALIHGHKEIDIYNNSWGTESDLNVCVLDEITRKALETGVTKGRKGKGSIYVQGARNGKEKGDNCAANCNINNPYVIGITAADQFGNPTDYAEQCTAIFATTYSENSQDTEGVVTADYSASCTTYFSGTSSAAPQASAIIALVLEANSELTYRDVMHLIAWSSEVAPLANNKLTWQKNGRGIWVSYNFGFGLMNAKNMVNLAKEWVNVAEKRICSETLILDEPILLTKGKEVTVPFESTACDGSETDEVNYLEHIEVESIVNYPYRGHIMVDITSPSGTRSDLLGHRYNDNDPDGLEGWNIMSTHHWGENPSGKWEIKFHISAFGISQHKGLVKGFRIKFHGTKEMPNHYKNKRVYAAFRIPNGETSDSRYQ